MSKGKPISDKESKRAEKDLAPTNPDVSAFLSDIAGVLQLDKKGMDALQKEWKNLLNETIATMGIAIETHELAAPLSKKRNDLARRHELEHKTIENTGGRRTEPKEVQVLDKEIKKIHERGFKAMKKSSPTLMEKVDETNSNNVINASYEHYYSNGSLRDTGNGCIIQNEALMLDVQSKLLSVLKSRTANENMKKSLQDRQDNISIIRKGQLYQFQAEQLVDETTPQAVKRELYYNLQTIRELDVRKVDELVKDKGKSLESHSFNTGKKEFKNNSKIFLVKDFDERLKDIKSAKDKTPEEKALVYKQINNLGPSSNESSIFSHMDKLLKQASKSRPEIANHIYDTVLEMVDVLQKSYMPHIPERSRPKLESLSVEAGLRSRGREEILENIVAQWNAEYPKEGEKLGGMTGKDPSLLKEANAFFSREITRALHFDGPIPKELIGKYARILSKLDDGPASELRKMDNVNISSVLERIPLIREKDLLIENKMSVINKAVGKLKKNSKDMGALREIIAVFSDDTTLSKKLLGEAAGSLAKLDQDSLNKLGEYATPTLIAVLDEVANVKKINNQDLSQQVITMLTSQNDSKQLAGAEEKFGKILEDVTKRPAAERNQLMKEILKASELLQKGLSKAEGKLIQDAVDLAAQKVTGGLTFTWKEFVKDHNAKVEKGGRV